MKFERENTKQIDFPSQKQVELSLSHLKGSKRSYASLTSDSGDFIQMAGGGFSCILEKSINGTVYSCLLYTSPSPRDLSTPRMPSSA